MDNQTSGADTAFSKKFANVHRTIWQLPVPTIVLSDYGQNVEFANDAFLRNFSKEYEADDSNSRTMAFADLFQPSVQQIIQKACELGSAVREDGIRVNLATKSGIRVKYLDVHAVPLFDEEDIPTSTILLTLLDTTDQVQSKTQFAQSERSYRHLLETMAVAVYTCDMEGRVNFHNEAAVTLWGRVPELGVELWCGSHKMYTLDGTWMPHEDCPAAVSFKEQRPVKAEALVQRPDGNMRHVLVFPRPEYDISGNMIGLINAVLDITDRKALERQKDDFMAIVAHELKTPMTSIKGYAQILMNQLSELSNEKIVHLHERMNDQLNNLAKLVDRMLNGAKIEAGGLEFKKQPYDLGQLVAQVVQDIRLTTTTHQLKVNYTGPIITVGDKEYTEQVVVNLISNAIKYSPKANQVNITIKQENNMAICSVRDFGMGIPSEQLSSIFEKFYRVKTGMSNKFPGIGLGLYLSAEIVRQQGGAIWSESTINEGSTFSFSLPM